MIINWLAAWYSSVHGWVWFDRNKYSHSSYSLANYYKSEYDMMQEGWVKVTIVNGEVDLTMGTSVSARRIVTDLVDQGLINWDSEVVIQRPCACVQKTAIYV